MVEEMSPAVIQETISRMLKPGTNIPECVEEFYEELRSATKFKRILATGYMVYEDYMHEKDPEYKKLSMRKVLKKFKTDSKGMVELRKLATHGAEKKKLE